MDKKRLIDADELLSSGFITENVRFKRGRFCIPWGDIKRSVKNAPTVDAVEVVRCKDCVNYCGLEHCKNGICDLDSVSKRAVYPNDFCSYGERREDNEP